MSGEVAAERLRIIRGPRPNLAQANQGLANEAPRSMRALYPPARLLVADMATRERIVSGLQRQIGNRGVQRTVPTAGNNAHAIPVQFASPSMSDRRPIQRTNGDDDDPPWLDDDPRLQPTPEELEEMERLRREGYYDQPDEGSSEDPDYLPDEDVESVPDTEPSPKWEGPPPNEKVPDIRIEPGPPQQSPQEPLDPGPAQQNPTPGDGVNDTLRSPGNEAAESSEIAETEEVVESAEVIEEGAAGLGAAELGIAGLTLAGSYLGTKWLLEHTVDPYLNRPHTEPVDEEAIDEYMRRNKMGQYAE